jgi:hypothetical protein
MFDQDLFLEKVWGDLLSRDAEKILARFRSLDPDSQQTVMDHLQKMVSEPDWHVEQVKSARYALQTLVDLDQKWISKN